VTAHIFERSGVSWIVFEELLHLLSQIRNVFVTGVVFLLVDDGGCIMVN